MEEEEDLPRNTTEQSVRILSFHQIKIEFFLLFGLVWPTAVSLVMVQAIFFVSLTFCSHIRDDSSLELDAVGFSMSIINITALSVAVGMGTAVDTLAAQAYGAKQYHKVGVYLQRAILILLLSVLPVYAIWFNLKTVLSVLHQPPCVIELTVQYIHTYSSCLPALFVLLQVEKYLRAQNIVYPFIITGIIANIVNVSAHVLFVLVAGWGVRGAAAAVSLATYTQLASLIAIIVAMKLQKKTWNGWSKEALLGWGQFFYYGLPGLAMFAIEEWSFEIGQIVSGTLPDGVFQQGIYSILNSFNNVLFTIPTAFSIAISVRIGNELGAGRPQIAKRSLIVGFFLCLVWGVFIEILMISFNPYIPALFTRDTCIIQAMSVPMYILSITTFLDAMQSYTAGVIRGAGKQLIGAVSNIFSYWLTGVPLGIILAIVGGLGAIGYWIGLGFAVLSQLIIYVAFILVINWKKLAIQVQQNVSRPSNFDSKLKVQYRAVNTGEDTVTIVDPTAEQSEGEDGDPSSTFTLPDSNCKENGSETHNLIDPSTADSTLFVSTDEESNNRAPHTETSPHKGVVLTKGVLFLRLCTTAVVISLTCGAVAVGQFVVWETALCDPYGSINLTNVSNSVNDSSACLFYVDSV